MVKKYGVAFGRVQPLHFAHQYIINEIMLDGLQPVWVLGSSNDNRDREKNPLTYDARKFLISLVYPFNEVITVKSYDYSSWDTWLTEIFEALSNKGIPIEECVFYYNNKEVDRYASFTFQGILYKDEFYTKIFEVLKLAIKEIEFVKRSDLYIDANARDIRHDLETNKHLLDARIYKQLKVWGWS